MKSRIILLTVFFSAVVIIISAIFYFRSKEHNDEGLKSENIIAVNELEQLALTGDFNKLSEKSVELQNRLRISQENTNGNIFYFVLSAICVVFFIIVFTYIYFAVLRPFYKMKEFAEKIACGNFDLPLDYERSNYFGDFTWAFDSMRREITRTRLSEREAVENNKTIIATLSHDIRTPIASIRAYAEGLDAYLDSTPEKRARYYSTIIKKCDEVSKLTNDLFLHSISDLDKLRISEEKVELCSFLESVVEEIFENNNINFNASKEQIVVLADRNRLMQVCENIINNSRKYAKTAIDLSVTVNNGFAQIKFKDYGNGIPDEDIPFIFDKFYRGKNCGSEQGSGLGLYIVKYITEKLKGRVSLCNIAEGFEITIFLPLA